MVLPVRVVRTVARGGRCARAARRAQGERCARIWLAVPSAREAEPPPHADGLVGRALAVLRAAQLPPPELVLRLPAGAAAAAVGRRGGGVRDRAARGAAFGGAAERAGRRTRDALARAHDPRRHATRVESRRGRDAGARARLARLLLPTGLGRDGAAGRTLRIPQGAGAVIAARSGARPAGAAAPTAGGRRRNRSAVGDLQRERTDEVDLHGAVLRGAQAVRDAGTGFSRLSAVRRRVLRAVADAGTRGAGRPA